MLNASDVAMLKNWIERSFEDSKQNLRVLHTRMGLSRTPKLLDSHLAKIDMARVNARLVVDSESRLRGFDKTEELELESLIRNNKRLRTECKGQLPPDLPTSRVGNVDDCITSLIAKKNSEVEREFQKKKEQVHDRFAREGLAITSPGKLASSLAENDMEQRKAQLKARMDAICEARKADQKNLIEAYKIENRILESLRKPVPTKEVAKKPVLPEPEKTGLFNKLKKSWLDQDKDDRKWIIGIIVVATGTVATIVVTSW